jgi:Leucine-rich repeat (LRR) protein
MKNFFLFFVITFCIHTVQAQVVAIPDAGFKRELLTQVIDQNGDDEIQVAEALLVKKLYVKNQRIKSLEGIREFKNLEELGCYQNELVQLDLRGLQKLVYLYANDNRLQSVIITGLVSLKHIYLHNNPDLLVNIDFTAFNALEQLFVSKTRCPALELKNLSALKTIEATHCRLRRFNIAGAVSLVSISIAGNELTEADFKQLPQIEFIDVSQNPLQFINIRHLKRLKQLSCLDCFRLKQINTSGCENLKPIIW